jgi:putative phosphoribosyl transferase
LPVAHEVALGLDAPLDTITVRKLGAPRNPELAIGAVASGGIRVLNDDLIAHSPELDKKTIEAIIIKERRELARREQMYRGNKPFPELRQRDVILVDDGMATGATMRAAAEAVLSQEPARVLVAVPTASREAVRLLEDKVDDVICLQTPSLFFAVGHFYRHFDQTSDKEVRAYLAGAPHKRSVA